MVIQQPLNQAVSGGSIHTFPLSGGNGGLEILQDWYDNPQSNYGFLIDLAAGNGNTDTVVEAHWYSSEQPVGAGAGEIPEAERPQLIVEFAVDTGQVAVAKSDIVVSFDSSSSRLYTLQSTEDPIGGNWVNEPGQVDRTGVEGPDAVTNEADTVVKDYRIGVRLP